jgi:transposase
MYGTNGERFQKQYRKHLSTFKDWEARNHAEEWLLFEENITEHLSIDEVCLSGGELYTVLTSKSAKGKKGSIVAIVRDTQSDNVIAHLMKINKELRLGVREITLDMAGSMRLISQKCFPNAVQVIDRFHVQQLATEALQEIRIRHRWEAIDAENEAILQAKKDGQEYIGTL